MSECRLASFLLCTSCAPCREAYFKWTVMMWDFQEKCSNGNEIQQRPYMYVHNNEGFPIMFSYKVYI